MSFRILLLLPGILALMSHLPAQVISIAQARTMPVGSSVTVRGIVTNGKELGKIRYLEDNKAGIAAFPEQGGPLPAGFSTAKPGDSIEVSGVLKMYNDLLEISPITDYKLLASSRSLPVPVLITIHDISAAYEGRLVRFDSLHFDNQDSVFASGNSTVVDNRGNRSQLYIHPGSAFIGRLIPSQPMELTAIVSRYKGFQLLPIMDAGKGQSALPKEKIYLASNIVTTTLVVKGCNSGKITVKNSAGYEVLFSLAHSSGTTQIDMDKLPPGAYTADIKAGKQSTSLPFQKN